MDITIGDSSKNLRGGILVRGVERKEEFIYGPGRVAYDRTNKKKKPKDIKMIKGNNKFSIINNKNKISSMEEVSKYILKMSRCNLS